jgi:Ca-activated chloride channel homolog
MPQWIGLLTLLAPWAAGQAVGGTAATFGMGPSTTTSMGQMTYFLLDYEAARAQKNHDQQEQPSEGVSRLDLKAPNRARSEYEKGVHSLLNKDYSRAAEFLTKAAFLYPQYVAAHNALGVAYMDLGRNDEARVEFQRAVTLDDHLPNPLSNLCTAALALKDYSTAEQAIKKASTIAPLNLEYLITLSYTQVLNHDYQDAIATARRAHAGKHENGAIVHFFAAAAWREMKNLPEMQSELETFLAEDPKNPNVDKANKLIAEIKQIQSRPKVVVAKPAEPTAAELEERRQVAEAETMCVGCATTDTNSSESAAPAPSAARPIPGATQHSSKGWLLRSSVDEVALFFAATDHGKAVTELTAQDVSILDDHAPPASLVDFRSESGLPLRLGILIDTSESITGRFSFERDAAAGFMQKVLTNPEDSAFVVGFSNSILLVQDLTSDQKQISHAIGQLAPAGGTALWDAIGFASQRLGSEPEARPTARILVVISDGEDNSSSNTLKQAIQAAERNQVLVYAVSTKEYTDTVPAEKSTGDRALIALAEQSGGAFFSPGSVMSLKRSLAELQQLIRSRYLISYKPDHFQADGQYRKIEIKARKSGRRLRVYARKGYYARSNAPAGDGS